MYRGYRNSFEEQMRAMAKTAAARDKANGREPKWEKKPKSEAQIRRRKKILPIMASLLSLVLLGNYVLASRTLEPLIVLHRQQFTVQDVEMERVMSFGFEICSYNGESVDTTHFVPWIGPASDLHILSASQCRHLTNAVKALGSKAAAARGDDREYVLGLHFYESKRNGGRIVTYAWMADGYYDASAGTMTVSEQNSRPVIIEASEDGHGFSAVSIWEARTEDDLKRLPASVRRSLDEESRRHAEDLRDTK